MGNLKPFQIAPSDKKIGRPTVADGGPMPNFSIRVPVSVREQLDYVYRNTNARSRSDVVVGLLEKHLPVEIAKIRKKLGLPT